MLAKENTESRESVWDESGHFGHVLRILLAEHGQQPVFFDPCGHEQIRGQHKIHSKSRVRKVPCPKEHQASSKLRVPNYSIYTPCYEALLWPRGPAAHPKGSQAEEIPNIYDSEREPARTETDYPQEGLNQSERTVPLTQAR